MDGYKMHEKIIKAIALRYREDEDLAPLVLAKGQGRIAEAILELANQSDIPTFADPELVKLLEGAEVGEDIPPEAYLLTAEIIAFLWRMEDKIKQNKE